ncbi:MAG TPA: SDR family oxidoreductase [Candidatus Angelobacter sp.]|nr:SDR family oxidoreductase [Candidatus Angelobacter sp.]
MLSASQPISLSGQTAVVTGGSRGIGRAIALKLAAAGARIAVLARSVRELAETVSMIQQAGGVAQAVPTDVSSAEAVHKAFQGIEQSLGPVDLLVNNAAAIKPFGPFWETDMEEWWRTMEVNVRGPLLCSQCVLPGMVARRRGRIINIVSGAGAVTTPYYTAYVTSKAALIRFTECVALEAREHGVALFSVSPGTVRTAMTEYSLTSPEGQKWLPWFRRIFDENINVPAERPAELVLELASGRVDALSGRMVSIYDDLNAMLANAAKIEKQNLYALKMDKLPTAGTNPAVGAILAAAREVAHKREK